MILDNAALLAVGLIAVCLIYRWGQLIFAVYALAHALIGEWFFAGVALTLACFIGVVQGLAAWLCWISHDHTAQINVRRGWRVRN